MVVLYLPSLLWRREAGRQAGNVTGPWVVLVGGVVFAVPGPCLPPPDLLTAADGRDMSEEL